MFLTDQQKKKMENDSVFLTKLVEKHYYKSRWIKQTKNNPKILDK